MTPPLDLWYLPPGVAPSLALPHLVQHHGRGSTDRQSPSPNALGEGQERGPRRIAISPELARAATAALDRVAPALTAMPVRQIIAAIDGALACWRQAGDPGRAALLEHGPALIGYSREALTYAIDMMLPRFGEDGLVEMLRGELDDPAVLDGFVPAGGGLRRMARGSGRQLHVFAGTVPTVPIFSLICGLLVKSPVLAKPSSHDPLFPAVFAQTLARIEPRLADALAVLPWPGGDELLEREAVTGAGAVIIYGSDETVAAYRALAPARARFIGYGHALSIAAVAREALTGRAAPATARRLAWDVALFDQHGCLSPQLALLESGGEIEPETFCALLADALAGLAVSLPRGALDPADHARIRALREAARFRSAMDPGVRLWESDGSTAWTVILQPRADQAGGCTNRTITVSPIDDLTSGLPAVCSGLPLSCIGLAASPTRARELEPVMARLTTRICPLGRMQEPPVTWRHDGRPNVADLVDWVEIETV